MPTLDFFQNVEFLPTENALFTRHNHDENAHGGWIYWTARNLTCQDSSVCLDNATIRFGTQKKIRLIGDEDGLKSEVLDSGAGINLQADYMILHSNGDLQVQSNSTQINSSSVTITGDLSVQKTATINSDCTVGTLYTKNGVYVTSDKRAKKLISFANYRAKALLKTQNLNLFYYILDGKRRLGLLAQDIKKFCPECVSDHNGVLYIDLYALLSVVLKAIIDLSQQLMSKEVAYNVG